MKLALPESAQQYIHLARERCWIIRSVRTKPDGEAITSFYVTPTSWCPSPVHATIFTKPEAADTHLLLYRQRDASRIGWADGSTEVFDVVPLYGTIVGEGR